MKKFEPITIALEWPSTVCKITEEQAKVLNIDITKDEIRGEMKTTGYWGIIVSYKAIVMSDTKEIIEGDYGYKDERIASKTFHGTRTMYDVKQNGYFIDGRVSVNGKKVRAFNSSQIFEVNGKLIDVAVIYI